MAWTGNFKTQIEDLAGTLTVTDDAATQQWILDGCYDVLKKAVDKYGPEEAWKFVAKSGNQTSNDIDVDEIRTITGVFRNGIHANRGAWHLKAKYADATSIYAATAGDPVWYLDDSKLTIYPAPSGGSPANYYYVPEYSLTNWNTSTSSVDNYPSEYYYYAMLYAAIQVLHRKMLDSAVPTTPTFEPLPVSPDIPVLSSIAYSPTANADVTSPTVSTTSYVAPSTALTAFDISGIAIPAATITAPNITAEGVSTLAKPDISGDVPLYNLDNTIVEFGTGTGQQFAALATKSVTSLSVTAVAPDTPVIDVVSYSPASTVTVSGSANISASGNVSVESINAADSSQPNYQAPTVTGAASLAGNLEAGATLGHEDNEDDFGKWFGIVGQYIEDEEDVELANATMQKISTFVNAYQVDVQNALNEFNEDAQVYQQLVQQGTQNANATNQAALNNIQRLLQENQANLQKNMQEDQINTQNAQAKALQDAQQTVQATIANNNALMQKYQAELSVYQAEVNTQVQEYGQNFQKELQLWQTTQSQIMQQHSQGMQDALNVFNAQNARYQANIQAEMLKAQTLAQEYQKEADIAMQAKIQDYTFELQEWSQELARYQANVASEAQAYQQKLSRYGAEQQDAVQAANIANQAHLQQAQLDLQVATRNKDKDLEAAIQNAVNTMQGVIQNNQSLLTKYQADISGYGSELSVYQADASVKLQKYQADLQAEGVSYQWLQDQYGRLKMEYESAFSSQQIAQAEA